MAVSPDSAGGPGIGTVIQAGFALADGINSLIGRHWNDEQRAAINAADAAGYVHTRMGWYAPDGTRVLERDLIPIGRAILNPPPITLPDSGPLPGNNPPIPQPTATSPFVVGSLYWGSKGPRKRKRKGKRSTREDKYGGWPGGPLCGTDTQCDQWARDHGVPWEARGPVPSIPDTMPPPVPVKIPRTIPRVVVGAAARWLNPFVWIFWPSRTADDDIITQPRTQPRTPSKGPTRRPVIRPRERMIEPGWRVHTWFPYEKNPWPQPRTQPQAQPVPAPAPRPAPAPAPRPAPAPGQRPAPSTRTVPAPGTPPWFDPLLPLLLAPLLANPPRVNIRPLTPNQPAPVEYPPPVPQPQPQPFRSDQCQCTDTKRRKRKDSCRNPIVSKRKRTKDGRVFQTITRELICQA